MREKLASFSPPALLSCTTLRLLSTASHSHSVVFDALVWAFLMDRCTTALMKCTVGCGGLCPCRTDAFTLHITPFLPSAAWKHTLSAQAQTYFPSSSTSAGAFPSFLCSSSSFFFLQSSLVIFLGSSRPTIPSELTLVCSVMTEPAARNTPPGTPSRV